MFSLKLIPHNEATQKQLNEIIRIKSKSWAYSHEKQVDWLTKNLNRTDIHVLLTFNKLNVAYLNLIDIYLKVDGQIKIGYGIGNVCSLEKGKGWGKEIMIQSNYFLENKNRIGLLFCRDTNLQFYIKNNWKLIGKEKIVIPFENASIKTMIFNFGIDFRNLEYSGRLF